MTSCSSRRPRPLAPGCARARERIVAGARPILHSAVAASLAWLVATELVGHEQPFFAPISAVITLGLTVGQRRRRAVELAIGVAVGIAIADALVAAIGTGTWQIGMVVALAMAAATLVGGGSLLASQAGASAVLVATLQPPEGGFDFDRSLDALVGAGVALVVSSLLLPVNPLRLVRESTEPVIERLVAALGADRDGADHAPARDGGRGAAGGRAGGRRARAPARDARGRRRGGPPLAAPRRARAASTATRSPPASWAWPSRTSRALARGAVRAINLDDAIPDEAIDAVEELADRRRSWRVPRRRRP